MEIKYAKNASSLKDIYYHLNVVSDSFEVSLSSRVDIQNYSQKLFDNADRFEAWDENKLVGLVACYKNNFRNELYITNVSVVHEYSGKGIASHLMNDLEKYAVENKIRLIRLETYKSNCSFYTKFGYDISKIISYEQNEMMKLIYNNEPIVSIRCITYNHEPYIAQCLEGFVIQKTNFKFEAIVHDDASTDKTADIIREYATKYPDIIKPIYETENQYSKHDGSLKRIMDEHTRGKYIAMCEGDDYWTDPYKLQKQVDFLEANKDVGLCYTDCDIYYEKDDIWEHSIFKNGQDLLVSKDILKPRNGWYCANMTWIFRSNWFFNMPRNPGFIDGALFILYNFCLKGNLGFISGSTGVYRRHEGSISCFTDKDEKPSYIYEKSNFLLINYFAEQFENGIDVINQNYYSCLMNMSERALLYNDTEIIQLLENRFGQIDLKIFVNELKNKYQLVMQKKELEVRSSKAYRLGNFLLKPFKWMKNIFKHKTNNNIN